MAARGLVPSNSSASLLWCAGETWGAATEIKLPNPNSKFSMCRVGTVLVVRRHLPPERLSPPAALMLSDEDVDAKNNLPLRCGRVIPLPVSCPMPLCPLYCRSATITRAQKGPL